MEWRKNMRLNIKKTLSVALCMVMTVLSVPDVCVDKAEAAEFKTGTFTVGSDTLPYNDDELYKQLFDINNIVDVKINMKDSELVKLHNDYNKYKEMSGSPIYRQGDVSINITIPGESSYTYNINDVGVRLKGNMTRKDPYNSNDGLVNIDHYKISFQEAFDKVEDGYNANEYYIKDGVSTWDTAARKARKDRTFAKLAKMDIKWNSNFDTTYIRQYYAYEMYRSEGICAPRTNLTKMTMNVTDKTANSAYLGVYTIIEPIDSEFIKNNLLGTGNNYIMDATGDYTDGDLYKAGWTNKGANLTTGCSYGIADDLTGYKVNYDLKTNKKKSADSPMIKDLLQGLSNVNSKESLAKLVDMDHFVKYAAVSYAVGNGDDMRNNYNNYYVYFYKTADGTQKAIFIPYDCDRAFGITNGYNPEKTGMTNVDPYSTNTAAQGEQKNPLYKQSVCKGGYYVDEYTDALKKVMENDMLSYDTFVNYYNIAKSHYGDCTTPAKDFDNTGKDKFYFTLDTNNDPKGLNTTSIDKDDKNLITESYLTRMTVKCNAAIGNSSNLTVADCYLRGEFSSWNVNDSYKLTYNKASGLYSFVLELSDTKAFKVYNSTKDAWYGYGNIEGSIPSGVTDEGGENSNIKAEAGKYYIIYNANTDKIQISTSEIQTETTTAKETTAKETTSQEITTKESTSAEEKTTKNETTKEGETEIVEYYTIVFNANGGKVGGKSTKSMVIKYNAKLKSLPSATRKGYIFKGWYTKKTDGTKITTSTKAGVLANGVYARWSKVKVAKATVSKLSNKSAKSASLVIKKVSGAKGYEIVYADNSKFKKSKKITITKLTTTIKKLSLKKTYYVKVRAYALDSTKAKVYGSYSSVKKVKITK